MQSHSSKSTHQASISSRPPPPPPLPASTPVAIRIITHNLGGSPTPEQLKDNEPPWSTRLPLIAAEIRFLTLHNPSAFFCGQEVVHGQLESLLAALNAHGDDWAYAGPELPFTHWRRWNFNPLLYRTSAWRLRVQRTTWLSDRPDEPASIGWDAKVPRMLTAGHFEHVATGKRVVGMCTHFDHKGAEARERSARVVAEGGVRSVTGGEGLPAFVAGDWNSSPDMPGYKAMLEGGEWSDVKAMVPAEMQYGNQITATGYGKGLGKGHIDYVFVNTGLEAKGYAILGNRFDDGVYYSDHRAVVVDLVL